MELTPAFFISLAVLLISVGGLVWGLSMRLGKTASERDLFDLELRLTSRLDDASRQSVQARNGYATKAELQELERDIKDELKEFRAELRKSIEGLTSNITHLAHQVTAEIARREREKHHG